jgi:DNA polymerase-3 subunit delta
MSEPGKNISILHGDDEFAISQECAQLIKIMQEEDTSGMNITRLEGRQMSEEDLRTAVNTLPFLSSRRLVLLNDLSHYQDSQRFLAILDHMPTSTFLVIQAFDSFDRGKWKHFDPEKHWLAKWVKTHSAQADWHEYHLPNAYAMPGWLQKQVKVMGGKITPQAADQLAEWIGTDTLQAEKELEKLLTYTNFERAIEVADVENLSTNNAAGNIFQFVDALAEHNQKQALNQLHRLMDDLEPVQIFSMVIRQFRLLLQVRELLDDGGGLQSISSEIPEIRSSLVAEKMVKLARRYDLQQLKEIYRRLLKLDQSLKTSQIVPELAFDILVAELTNK